MTREELKAWADHTGHHQWTWEIVEQAVLALMQDIAAAESREKALRGAVKDHSCEECGRVFGSDAAGECRRCRGVRAALAAGKETL